MYFLDYKESRLESGLCGLENLGNCRVLLEYIVSTIPSEVELDFLCRTHIGSKHALISQILDHLSNQIQLVLSSQRNRPGNHFSQASLVSSNKSLVVKVREHAHDELAIHPVGDAAVTRDRITKVLDLERPLQARCKESTKRSDQ